MIAEDVDKRAREQQAGAAQLQCPAAAFSLPGQHADGDSGDQREPEKRDQCRPFGEPADRCQQGEGERCRCAPDDACPARFKPRRRAALGWEGVPYDSGY